MRHFFILAFTALSLAACMTPERRIESSLVQAGLSRPVSSCMADKMVNQLSLTQLRRLSSLSGLKDRKIENLSVKEFLHHVRALKDPEILSVTTRAGFSCAISS